MASFVMMGSCSRFGNLCGALLSPENTGAAVFVDGGAKATEYIVEDGSEVSVGLTSLITVDVMVGRTPTNRAELVIWGCGASFPGEFTPEVKEGIVLAGLLLSATGVDIDAAVVEVVSKVAVAATVAPLSTCNGASASSSDSESSLSDISPTVEGLLNGESGLSGPSSTSAPAAGIVLATGSTWRMRFGKTLTGDGRRS